MTNEEIIKSFTIDRKVINISVLKNMVKKFKKNARDRSKSAKYRYSYKKLMKYTRSRIREEQAELYRLRTT